MNDEYAIIHHLSFFMIINQLIYHENFFNRIHGLWQKFHWKTVG
jgi:hypothetical protein